MASAKYREIAAVMAAEIAGLPPGTKVDGELAVAARFGVSRAAARAAVQELERQFLVRRVRGLGTFTSRRVDYLISSRRPPSWSQTLRDAGATPRTVVRSCVDVPMPAAVAHMLHAVEGSAVWRLQRCSFTDDLPASWGTEWVPAATVPELPAALRRVESLDRILRDIGAVVPARSRVRASMEAAGEEVADELAIGLGAPVWLVESLNKDATSGAPVYLTERWIRADAIRVVFEAGDIFGQDGSAVGTRPASN
ncbi:GntR family transcriptional regulator [Jiangella asiatica]|uniref:GntR family transcriptional regulator n=1 Tax=Jiangella asiatica TaxID=2530372 RepID=A0A4R5DP39_9ACTN|nr:GntR family transcriptional regulator [Jiangella asiatica]TDE15999.1 GntR family transcriptional regulator [Jiangella asiatica]